ncbi:MAG: transcription termination/antitermination protein NusA, partial [Anaerolineae bacterium]|nr:transcription termination/antitermination protein NusA [Anaerolineae bacterium]
MVNELKTAFDEIAEMRALPPDVVLEALQSALVSAYRRDSGASSAQRIEARIDPGTGRARIFVEKEVTEEIFSPSTEVTLEKARFYEPEAELGDTVMVQVEHTTKKFGRIAAQTAKQVILQKIREAERNALYDEFIDKEGDLIIGTVQSMNQQVVTLRLNDRAEAILPRSQQIPGERYRQHEKLRVYIMEVKRTNKGPQIVCSRSHRNMLRRLLEYEVPEIYNGQVEIKSIAREAGYRSKVAVAALQEGIDPVGACVGMRGIRIQNIVKELHDEKIDVIEWNPEAEGFISKALSPARVVGVYLDDDIFSGRTAVVVVPDDQLSLAIGREGQNARLAAKLTGWRIDIKSVTETVLGALENLDLPPLDELQRTHAPLIAEVKKIMEKRDANKAVMPEEFNTLNKFAGVVERRLQRIRDDIRQSEMEQMEAVRATLPEALFNVPIVALGLDEDVTAALEELGSVGNVVLYTLTNEEWLEKTLSKVSTDALPQVQAALDELMEGDVDFDTLVETEADEESLAEAEPVAEAAPVVAEPDVVDEQPEEVEAEVEQAVVPEAEAPVIDAEEEAEEEEEEVLLDAFGGVIEEPAPEIEEEEPEPELEYLIEEL